MRGEDLTLRLRRRSIAGSPPHARGRRLRLNHRNTILRITPACAGKTVPGGIILKETEGSPPHARGRHIDMMIISELEGITPACAGKTRILLCTDRAASHHPRMRGEDDKPCKCDKGHFGSPPHARGRRSFRNNGANLSGITPACAGKTTGNRLPTPPSTDHPRMRGEDH